MVIAATGGFGNPYRPPLAGLDHFTGEVVHVSEYRSPARYGDQNVVVVGAGNSAAQVAVELTHHARVTLASRARVKYAPQTILGRDMHWWATTLGFDHLPIGPYLRTKPSVPVIDDGTYRPTIDAGRPARRPLFTAVDGTRVTWADGRTEHVDTSCSPPGTAPTCPISLPCAPWIPAAHPCMSAACPAPTLGWPTSGWSGSAASRPRPCAGSAATPPTSCSGSFARRTPSRLPDAARPSRPDTAQTPLGGNHPGTHACVRRRALRAVAAPVVTELDNAITSRPHPAFGCVSALAKVEGKAMTGIVGRGSDALSR